MAKVTLRAPQYELCLNEVQLRAVLEAFYERAAVNGYGIDTETGGLDWKRDPLYMISLFTEGCLPVVVPLAWPESTIRLTALRRLFLPLTSGDIKAYFWNAKFDMHFLKGTGIEFTNPVLDVHVAAHLINNEAPGRLKLRAKADLGMKMTDFKELFNLTRGKTLLDYPLHDVARYAADDAVATYRLAVKYMGERPDIQSRAFALGGQTELGTLFQRVEIPITNLLFRMEDRGVLANTENIEAYERTLAPKIEKAQEKIYRLAGTSVNLNSPKQLLPLLIGRGHKLTSTDAEALKAAHAVRADPLLGSLLEYREYEKIRGTYIEGLLHARDGDGAIHTTFNQAGTETGRFSSSGPNLQNIPREGAIRAFFKPRPGHIFIVRDFGQLELRVAAHAANDAVMIEEFRRGMDIHSLSAAGIFNKPYEEVTPEERQVGKSTSSFGVLFGMSPTSLALKLGVSEVKAELFIINWFKKYRGIDQFFKRVVESAKQTGYVVTFLGRVRFIEALKNPKSNGARNAALREAKNTTIQGPAADLVKLAMLWCDASEELHALGAHMLLQVHDELMFEVPEENAYRADQIIAERMTNFPVATKLKVPLTTDGGIGYDWNSAKKGALNEQFAQRYGG